MLFCTSYQIRGIQRDRQRKKTTMESQQLCSLLSKHLTDNANNNNNNSYDRVMYVLHTKLMRQK